MWGGRYHSKFGNNFRVYSVEDLKKEPLILMKRIYSFLGVDDSFFPELKTLNKTHSVYRVLAQTILLTFSMNWKDGH